MEKISFEGQVAVITGAGRGLGESYARELARRGAAVVVNDLAGDSGGKWAADEIVAAIVASGGTAIASHDDISRREGGEAIIGAALAKFGRIDILINNAGFLRPAPFEDLTPEDISSVINVHLFGAFHTTKPAWDAMRERGYGRIIMTSSSSSFGQEGNANYSAAKAALIGLTNTLALEGRKYGIQVNGILPLSESSISKDAPQQSHKNARLVKALDGVAGRRPPLSVAHLVVYLASRECRASAAVYSAAAGRFARVFFGTADGWLADDIANITPELIGDHIQQIDDLSRFTAPQSAIEEIEEIVARLRMNPNGAR